MANKGKLKKSKPITFKDRNDLENYLKTGSFALMTGHSHKLSPEESHKQHQSLINDLTNMGIPFTHVAGKWGGIQGEPSVMIHGIDQQSASDLARKYKQISHIQSSAGKHMEISHDPTYRAAPGGEGHEVGEHLEDNYSEIKLPSGEVSRFSLNTGYDKMKKKEEVLSQEELAKTSKNVKQQKKKLFGTQGNPPPKSKFGQKQIEQQKKFAQKRYGVDIVPSKGKINQKTGERKKGSIEGFDKPDWRSGKVESQWNPGAITHEFGHLEQMPEGRRPEEHQTIMDKEVGEAIKFAGAPTHAFRHPSEVQARAAENPLRRRMGLPPLTTRVKVKEGEEERKVIGTDKPAAVRYKDKKGQLVDQIKTAKLLSDENRERMDQVDSGELVYSRDKGWQKGDSINAKINARAREAAKKGYVSYFRSLLTKPEKLAASEKTVSISKKDLASERRPLVGVLKSKSHKNDKVEAKEQRKQLKEHMGKGQDPLAAQVTSEKGVSERGIEARRADVRNKGVVSHGYGRVTSPEKHAARAKNYFRSTLEAIKKQPKANLPKSEKSMEKEDKPFHGYNKNKHSKKGGLNDKARKKYNRETGSNLKRPVTGKPKPGSKAAARKKSFCARMSGVKGPTSKDGKLTPKGAALKRWNCSKEERVLSFEDIAKSVMGKQKIGISPAALKQQSAQLPPVKPMAQPPAPVVNDVAGVALPKELHEHFQSGNVVPYDHPHREMAAKFVTDVWRKNRAEGARMSEKLLGIGEGGKSTSQNTKPSYSTLKSEKITKNDQKKYVHIHQGYRDILNNKPNRFLKERISHINDLAEVSKYHGRDMHTISSNPKPSWGTEVHKINPDGSLTYVGSHYDTSD